MSFSTGAIIAILTVLVAMLTRVGYLRMTHDKNRKEKSYANAVEHFGTFTALGKISYHGGLHDYPNSTTMNLGLNHNSLILFDETGYTAAINVLQMISTDSFILRQASKSPFKSFILLGPFSPLFFKDKWSFMVTINYIQDNGEENNLLLEAESYPAYCKLKNEIPQWFCDVGDKEKNTGGDSGLPLSRTFFVQQGCSFLIAPGRKMVSPFCPEGAVPVGESAVRESTATQ